MMNNIPNRCFTCRSMTVKCPPRPDIADGWDFCRVHKRWFKNQTGHMKGDGSVPPGMRGAKCLAWQPNIELLAKMEEFGTEFQEVAATE